MRESPRPEFHHSGIIEVLFGGAFNVVVSFPSRGRSGQRDAELIGKVERKAEIFVHEAQGKTGNVFAFQQIGSLDVQNAGNAPCWIA